jgi:transcriptional regulator with XRE-family HTH domain
MIDKNPLRNKYYLLGRRIQYIRRKRGLTQQRLAEELGISLSFLGRVEIGSKSPSLKMVFRIADVLDVKPEELFKF